jgi:hypothetical protein
MRNWPTGASVAAISLLALATASGAQATTAVSGTLNVVANSTINNVNAPDLHTGSWAVVPANLSESASATATNGNDFVTTSGAATANWASADAGSVAFSNYGWHFSVFDSTTTQASSDLVQGRGGDDWTYTFTATQNGAINMGYNVNVASGNPFGLWGWSIDWSGAGGGLPVSNAADPTASGVFTRSLVAGQTYTIGLNGNPNIGFAGPSSDYAGFMNGNFDWSITSAVPEPASWALMLLGFGGLGAALRSRRRMAAATA